LRTNHLFLSAALKHPSTSFLLLNNLAPLAKDPTKLEYVSYEIVREVIGDDPYSKPEAEVIAEYNSTIITPQLLFLGLDERNKESFQWSTYRGSPFFALDVTPRGSTEVAVKSLIGRLEARGLQFVQGRLHMTLPAPEAAIYAQARSLLDWNARNPFCAACGQPTLSINGGMKRTCPPKDLAALPTKIGSTTSTPHSTDRPDCATRKGISNLCFPRTDPTVIVAVVSADARRILVGRQKRWPPHWYSTLAGFVEPAESAEEAIRREVWEESGVALGRVVLHSTQPWPYPASLMIGAVAQTVSSGEEIVLKHDPELEAAKWVSFDEVREALRIGTSALEEAAGEGYKEGSLRLPPSTAIANQLLSAVVGGFLGEGPKI
jgi:NAD+ diphosphatase